TGEQLKHCIKDDERACDELALRFHWNLVYIHLFPNGNGRHARMMADLLAQALGRPPFTWGLHNLAEEGEARSAYLAALRKADKTSGDVEDLLMLARHPLSHAR
ncbi:MAG: Fic family protein, partial [Coriobacteriia bacterium]|nr:Fic family protein [Coriobacteriia bacterium]